MGLFGGFKANFTSRIRKKPKDDGVVCLKYVVHSEFDRQMSPPAVPLRTTIPKKPIIKSAYIENSTTLERNLPRTQSLNEINTDALSSERLATNTEKKTENEYEDPDQKPSTSYSRPTSLDFSESRDSSQTATNSLYFTSNDYGKKVEKTGGLNSIDDDYEEVTPVEESKNFQETNNHADKSPLIFMTQVSFVDGEKNAENGEDNFETNIQAMRINGENISNGNFKIKEADSEFHVHFVKNDLNKSYSVSEDELSEAEEEIYEYRAMGYSSQAASIFFGEADDPPVVSRPRRVVLSGYDDVADGNDC